MNAKELKFLELFEQFVRIDIAADKLALGKFMTKFMNLDYQMAINVWEYLATVRESKLASDEKLADILGFELFNQFYTVAAVKCAKAIAEVGAIRRAVYQYTKRAGEENALTILVESSVTNKLDATEEMLKCLVKNPRIHYGQTLKRALERINVELLKKNAGKATLPKKLADLFLVYVGKIKTDEKAMLVQRIKERR